MMIIAIDPGLMTGLAWYDAPTGRWGTEELTYPDVIPRLQHLLLGANMFNADDRVYVACEKYVMLPGPKSSQPEALMHMGAIEWVCRREQVPLTWQFPREAKTRAPDTVLRRIGWYKKTKDGHANDAARHVIEWLACNNPTAFADLLGI